MSIRSNRREFVVFAMLFLALMFGGSTTNLKGWRAEAAQDSSQMQMPYLERVAAPAQSNNEIEGEPSQSKLKLNLLNTPCTVNQLTDNNPGGGGQGAGANGDLRYCMTQANTNGGSNTISFVVTGTINLAGELPLINNDLTINGPGANMMTVQRSTGGDYRIFTINVSRVVTVSGLTITKGRVLPNGFTGGGGFFVNPGATLNLSDSVVTDNEGYSFGGGILSYGALNINNCTISFNKAGNGGGFYILFTTATIANSTVNNNTTDFQAGIGIQDSVVGITNCTVSNNSATTGGGGIVSRGFSSAATTVTNSTVANNSGPGAALWVIKIAGATAASLSVKNTLAASNSPANFANSGGTLTSLGHNLDTDGTSGFANGVNGNIIGSAGSPIDAKLVPLADNGGPTQTRALLCGSPARDAGDNNGAPTMDQRGVARPINSVVDIGAYEANQLCLGALPNGKVGIPYNETPTVMGGPAPYTFSVIQGVLPTGLILNSATGQLSGLVMFTGTWNFTLQVTNAMGGVGTQSYSLTFTCATIIINPGSLLGGAVGAAYNQTVSATPAGGSYSYIVAGGVLPNGLALNSSTGAISGTPALAGTFNFLIQATGFGTCTGTMSYSIVIGGNQCPMITLPALPNGNVGQMYNNSIAASPAGSYSYAVTAGSLPPGLTLYGGFGLVFGYPSTPGTYNFTITATDANNCSGSKSYSVTIGSM